MTVFNAFDVDGDACHDICEFRWMKLCGETYFGWSTGFTASGYLEYRDFDRNCCWDVDEWSTEGTWYQTFGQP